MEERQGRYNKKELCKRLLSTLDCDFKSDLVQNYWNELENQLVAVLDDLVPLRESTSTILPTKIPDCIKHKMNERNLKL